MTRWKEERRKKRRRRRIKLRDWYAHGACAMASSDGVNCGQITSVVHTVLDVAEENRHRTHTAYSLYAKV